ncbi:MAG: MMPL family transporter [Burkholderiales bacterium]
MKSHPRAALVAWLLLVVAGAWWIARHTTFSNDLTAFLPTSGSRTEQSLIEHLRSGAASRTLLIAVEGAEPPKLAEASRKLAAALLADRRFDFVTNGADDHTRAARDLVLRNRYLLSPAVDEGRFGEASLRRALQENLDQLASLSGLAFKGMLARDPTGELRRIGEASVQGAPATRHGVWFSENGERALLLAQTAASGMDAVRQQDALDAVTRAMPDRGLRVRVSGPGTFAASIRAAIERDARWLTGIAVALVVLILMLVYRSPGTVALSALPVLTGLIAGVAAVSLVFGSVHGITLAFGVTLIGEAVDYPSYVFAQRRAGETVLETLGRVWPTLRLAALTTVFGSLALLLSSLQGLSQLGILSMVGVLTAGLVTRWVLPVLAPGAGAPPPRAMPFSLIGAGLVLRRGAWLAWALLAAALAFIAVRHERIWDDDLGHLSPLPEEARRIDRQLRADLRAADAGFLLTLVGASREAVLAHSERVALALEEGVRQGILDGFDAAARYLPSEQTQKHRRAALPDPGTLRRSLARAQRGLPYREDAFAPFLREVEAARTGPLLGIEDLHGTGLDLKVSSLLLSQGGEWTAFISLRGVHDQAGLRALAERLPAEARAGLLDLKATSDRLIGGYRAQALSLAGVGALAIALLLYVGLRDAGGAFRVMVPVYAAIAMTVACLLLLGEGLSLFHLVSLLLVLGVGLNYALFFNRAELGSESERETSLALSVCFLTTLSAFGCLATSRIPVLSAIGLTVSIGSALSLLNAMVLGRGGARSAVPA